ATVTPSLVTVGEPKLFCRMTLRPLGPSVTLTARASLAMPRRMASRASWSNAICFAAILPPIRFNPPGATRRTGWAWENHLPVNDSQHVFLAHDEDVVAGPVG